MWQNSAREELLSINAIDYYNARLLKVDYEGMGDLRTGKCTIYQFSEPLMMSK